MDWFWNTWPRVEPVLDLRYRWLLCAWDWSCWQWYTVAAFLVESRDLAEAELEARRQVSGCYVRLWDRLEQRWVDEV